MHQLKRRNHGPAPEAGVRLGSKNCQCLAQIDSAGRPKAIPSIEGYLHIEQLLSCTLKRKQLACLCFQFLEAWKPCETVGECRRVRRQTDNHSPATVRQFEIRKCEFE